MKPSKYNIIVDHPETGETILYNSLYGSLTLWEPSEFDIVKTILANPLQNTDANSDIRNALIEQKHLVSETANEFSIIEERKTLGIQDENRLDLIMMPTLECNFACVYCYEDRRPGKMTTKTETAIKKWLETQIPKYKVVLLHWFGGEPLIGYKQLLSVSEHVTRIAAESDTKCITHITTNGYLLNKARINTLINTGIYDFQITVDGPPETHDKLRVLRNGKGTFARLLQNINDLARVDERVKISLRVNFNHSNLHSIPRLLELFPPDVRPHLRVVYEPIFGRCSLSATDNLQSEEISEAMTNYYQLAEQLGYDVVLAGGGIHPSKLVYCYAERENQFIINYNGDVFKCSVSKFEPEERVGHIHSDGIFVQESNQWNKWVGIPLFEEQCYDCVYLPLCMGGCRNMRLQKKGTGSHCSLIPTNTSYILKQIALGQFENVLRSESNINV